MEETVTTPRIYGVDSKVEYHPYENCSGVDVQKRGIVREVLTGIDKGFYLVQYQWWGGNQSGKCKHHWRQLLPDTYGQDRDGSWR